MRKILYFACIAEVLCQFVLSSAAQAQSMAEQKICRQTGSYAVFAAHPLFQGAWGRDGNRPNNPIGDAGNIELSHEHIFFCDSGRISDNIGFGTVGPIGGTFKYSVQAIKTGVAADGGRVDNFVPIDSERYDPNIIREVLAKPKAILSDRCDLRKDTILPKDGIYGGVVNNCQGWTARVRDEYWERVPPKITAFYCEGQKNKEACVLPYGKSTKLVVEYTSRSKNPISWQISGYTTGQLVAEGENTPSNGSGVIRDKLKCTCQGAGCREPLDKPMYAFLKNKRGKEAKIELKQRCKPGVGQVIKDIAPSLPIRIPKLPF